MKNGKKFTAALTASAVVAALVLPTVASASSVTFSDISNSYAQQAILDLANAGILHGDQGKFNPTGKISRQDFAIILVNALKLPVTAGATSQFGDVAGYAQAYVKAATDAGLIKGYDATHFGGSDSLTREQMAALFVRGLHYANGYDATGKASNLKFSDNSSISSNFQDAVGAAVELGLISGMSDNKGGMMFNPQGNAERQAVALVASKFLAAAQVKHDLKLTASATNVGVGQKVTLSVSGTTDAVVWSVDKNGVVDASGNFVGTSAGAATVTAVVDGQTLTQVINVYGAAASVMISTTKDLVANNNSQETLTFTVVDSAGNPVNNFNGTVDVSTDADAAQYVDANGNKQDINTSGLGALVTLDVTNGVATATFQSNTTVAGQATDVTVANLINTDNGKAVTDYVPVTATINSVDQVATSIKVTPQYSTISANAAVTDADKITATVLDQDGQVMANGTYGLTFHVTGPVQIDANGTATTDDQNVAFVGAAPAAPSILLNTLKGQTGNATITVSGDGLTSATATVKVAVAQDAAKLAIANDDSTATSNAFTQGDVKGVTFDVSATDANGTPIDYTDDGKLVAYITDASGNYPADLQVSINGAAAVANSSAGIPVTGTANVDGTSKIQVNITDDGKAAVAGTYKLVVKDTASSGLTATPDTSFTVNAASASKLSLSAGTNYVNAASPTTTFTAQVTDAFGNKIAKAGVPVLFTATNTKAGDTTKASFNGKAVTDTTATVTVKTDANGVATANFTTQGYNGITWSVVASDDADKYTASSESDVTVVSQPVASLKLSVTGSNGSATSLTAGDTFGAISITEKDQYGATVDTGVENDNVKVTVSNPSAFVWGPALASESVDSTNGVVTGSVNDVNAYLATLVAHSAGSVTITVTDTSVSSAKAATAGIRVAAGGFDHFDLFDASGKIVNSDNEVTVDANKAVALNLKPVDKEDNAIVADQPYTVSLGDGGSNGYFSTVLNGAPAAANSVDFTAGKTSMMVYYVNATAGTYLLTSK